MDIEYQNRSNDSGDVSQNTAVISLRAQAYAEVIEALEQLLKAQHSYIFKSVTDYHHHYQFIIILFTQKTFWLTCMKHN